MSTHDDATAALAALRNKCGYRHGQITKIGNCANRLLVNEPDEIRLTTIRNLLDDLKTHIDAHDAIHTQMGQVYDSYPNLLSTDEELRGEYIEMLKPALSRSYALNHDDAKQTSSIRQVPLEPVK